MVDWTRNIMEACWLLYIIRIDIHSYQGKLGQIISLTTFYKMKYKTS